MSTHCCGYDCDYYDSSIKYNYSRYYDVSNKDGKERRERKTKQNWWIVMTHCCGYDCEYDHPTNKYNGSVMILWYFQGGRERTKRLGNTTDQYGGTQHHVQGDDEIGDRNGDGDDDSVDGVDDISFQ